MILSCPACGIRFKIDPSVLGPRGRQVRCGKCTHTWYQEPDKGTEEPERPQDFKPEMAAAAALPPPPDVAPEPGGSAAGAAGAGALGTAAPPADSGSGEGLARLEAFDQARLRAELEREQPGRRPRRNARLAVAWLALLVFVGALGAALWFGRATIVAYVPEAARLYQLAGVEVTPISVLGEGLELRDVNSFKRLVNGQKTLLIEGSVVNISDQSRPVPALRAIITDAEGAEVSQWTFTTDREDLAPGDQTTFQTSTADPVRGVNLSLIFVEKDT
jgi:predicted Zn finger-like uncharacterized protein